MKHTGLIILFLLTGILVGMVGSCEWFAPKFKSQWTQAPDRTWIGSQYWANRLQDWRLQDGRVECIGHSRAVRTLHLLTRELGPKKGKLRMSVQTGRINEAMVTDASWAGFLIGAGSLKTDYRRRALIHQGHGKNGGLLAVITSRGKLMILDNANRGQPMDVERDHSYSFTGLPVNGVSLHLQLVPGRDQYQLTFHATAKETGETIDSLYMSGLNPRRFQGNLALAAHASQKIKNSAFWFNQWWMRGSKLVEKPGHHFGPILGAHYSLNNNTLHMTAQLPPLSKKRQKKVRLEIRKKGRSGWQEIARSDIVKPGYTATFSIDPWQTSHTWKYRLSYPLKEAASPRYFKGSIPREPSGDKLLLAALNTPALTGQPIGEGETSWNDSSGFPYKKMTQNIGLHQPDMLAFTGNQVNPGLPTHFNGIKKDSLHLDYLYKWYLFCWGYGKMTRKYPTIILPSQTDFYQVKGDTGKKSTINESSITSSFIRMVRRTQTGHLPSPYTPDLPGHSTAYNTEINYAGISLAVLGTGKFFPVKDSSRLNPLKQEASYRNQTASKPNPSAKQLPWIQKWAGNWAGVHMKAVITPEPVVSFSSYTHLSKRKKAQTDQLLREIRKAHALIISGGKNPAHAIHLGIDKKGDAGYSFGLPPNQPIILDNPKKVDSAHLPLADTLAPENTFQHELITPVVVNNMSKADPNNPGQLPQVGYGIIQFNKKEQTYTLSAWPQTTTPAQDDPLAGWPLQVNLQYNFIEQPLGFLPQIITKGLKNKPVYKLFNQQNQNLIYARRAHDTIFQAPVFKKGLYTLLVGNPKANKMDTLSNLVPVKHKKQIILNFKK